MIQPQVIRLQATTANQRVVANRTFATHVKIRLREGTATAFYLGFSTPNRTLPNNVTFDPPGATLAATTQNTIVLADTAGSNAEWVEFDLSAAEIERGEFFDLKEWYYAGAAGNEVAELVYWFAPINA